MQTIGLVGAGHIGGLLSDQLLAADYSLVVHDVDRSKVTDLVDRGADAAADPADVGDRAEAVFLALPGAPEVESVALDEGLVDALDPDELLVDASTTGPETATAVAEACADRGVDFLSAPVTRGGPGEGLHAMAGGPADVYEAATPLLDDVTAAHERIGDPGDAQRFKLALQLRYAGQMAVDTEVVAFARDQDLPAELLNDLLDLGVSERLLEGDFSPAHPGMGGFAIWRKDLGYLRSVGAAADAALPLAGAVHDAYKHANRVRDEDERHAAALLRHWRRLNGA